MTMQALTDATAALTAAAQAYNGKVQEIDDQLASFISSVGAEINSHMHYKALVDPELSEPNVANKEFQSINQVMDYAYASAMIDIEIPAGRTVYLDSSVNLVTGVLRINKIDSGVNPKILVGSYLHSSGDHNAWNGIRSRGRAALVISQVDIEFEDKVDPAKPWDGTIALLLATNGIALSSVGMEHLTVSGPDGAANVIAGQHGSSLEAVLYNVVLDGVQLLQEPTSSTAIIAAGSVTLENGASLYHQVETPDGVLEKIYNLTDNT